MRDLTKEEMQALIREGEYAWTMSDILPGCEFIILLDPQPIFCYRKGEIVKCIDLLSMDHATHLHDMEEMITWFKQLD